MGRERGEGRLAKLCPMRNPGPCFSTGRPGTSDETGAPALVKAQCLWVQGLQQETAERRMSQIHPRQTSANFASIVAGANARVLNAPVSRPRR